MRRAALGIVTGLLLAACSSAARTSSPGVVPPSTIPSASASASASASGAIPSTTIAAENQRPGDRGWQLPDDPKVWAKVSGYADQVSAERGQTVGLYVRTEAPSFTVTAYRMGWYGGARGRVVWRSADVASTPQPPVEVDPATQMRREPWTKSLDVAVGADWVPGFYLLKLASSDGGASMVPLTVRDDSSRAAILISSGVTTWQAYNGWGGANLYTGGDPPDGKQRAKVVSFDRPYWGDGTGEYFSREDGLLAMVEAAGMDVSYTTDVDVHARPELVRNHKVLVLPTHDEYWTKEMRDGVEAARDAGVNLVFMGANAVFRRIRLEPSALGPYRQEVNYRNAKDDPLRGIDDERVTTSWREPPAARPESSLVGDLYECNPVDADMVIAEASSWVFAGTGWANGTALPHVVGNEYDRVTPEAPTPPGIEVLAHSPLTCKGRKSFADMTYYTAPSGAGVWATGTFMWEPLLGPACPDPTSSVECGARRATLNVLEAFAAGPAATSHPSMSNLTELGIRPGYIPDPPR